MQKIMSSNDPVITKILNSKALNVALKFKLYYIFVQGNENQKRFVSKVADRYVNYEPATKISTRVTTRINELFDELKVQEEAVQP